MEQNWAMKLLNAVPKVKSETKTGQYLKTELETHFNKFGSCLLKQILNDGIDGILRWVT
jgi:hypothetical protein